MERTVGKERGEDRQRGPPERTVERTTGEGSPEQWELDGQTGAIAATAICGSLEEWELVGGPPLLPVARRRKEEARWTWLWTESGSPERFVGDDRTDGEDRQRNWELVGGPPLLSVARLNKWELVGWPPPLPSVEKVALLRASGCSPRSPKARRSSPLLAGSEPHWKARRKGPVVVQCFKMASLDLGGQST
ncbi:unnamed protein product [Cuscuta campestris]|uniref:Uncharacterized protein n=1 Tax=Cuscuta campestris TaxID=132261 RepID=A0A484KCM2_9ASTE|nr:unnamed protein product [Cuscuta campestris]